MSLTNAEVNARLARLAGWKEAVGGFWIEPYTPEPRSRVWSKPPNYCSSLDLLRRDVLGLLTDIQVVALTNRFILRWNGKGTILFSALTAPADVIARAALAALEGDDHD